VIISPETSPHSFRTFFGSSFHTTPIDSLGTVDAKSSQTVSGTGAARRRLDIHACHWRR